MDGASSWFESLAELITNAIKKILIESCTGVYNSLFKDINSKINEAGATLSQSPAAWSGNTFNLINTISESVIIPIAGLIITYVFCYEIINMVTDANSMKTVKISDIMSVLIKTALAIIVFNNSFKIVMAFFDVGNYITAKVSTASVSMGGNMDISTELAAESIVSLGGLLGLLLLAKLLTFFSGMAIYIAVNTWFLEIFIYSSVAAIPFATFMNKEWGQIGYNYTRRIMALAFQSFFMLLCLAIYGARLCDVPNGDLVTNLMEILGGGVILVFMLFKCGNISSSIFNAH